MIKKIKKFDRGDHWLFIDRETGHKWKQKKGASGPKSYEKVVNFTKAAAKQVAKGNPKVSLEVIQSRFEICKNCPDELYHEYEEEKIPQRLKNSGPVGTCTHRTCGCYLHGTEKFPNKLSWGTSVCPRGHWGKDG